MRQALSVAAMVAAFVLIVAVGPSGAQFAPITFLDTAVGATSTVKCPDTTVSLCFGDNCGGSGTVLSFSAPGTPFSVSKFNLLSLNDFFAGNCEAHPVSLPVTVGADQVFTYQATFAPTSAGTFNGSLTINTNGGPATVNLSGKGITGTTTQSEKGFVAVDVKPRNLVPGNAFSVGYSTARGDLKGNVDLYFVLVLPSGGILFVTDTGGLTTTTASLRRNFAVTTESPVLFNGVAPVDMPFGHYTFAAVLTRAGSDPLNKQNWVSPLSLATLDHTPLSADQTSILSARGQPDLLVVTWIDALNQKQETWMYRTGNPNKFVFLNGELKSQTSETLTAAEAGPRVDPALFTPQTTLASLTAALGPPLSVTPVQDAPEWTLVRYASGLEVVLLNGRLSSAIAAHP